MPGSCTRIHRTRRHSPTVETLSSPVRSPLAPLEPRHPKANNQEGSRGQEDHLDVKKTNTDRGCAPQPCSWRIAAQPHAPLQCCPHAVRHGSSNQGALFPFTPYTICPRAHRCVSSYRREPPPADYRWPRRLGHVRTQSCTYGCLPRPNYVLIPIVTRMGRVSVRSINESRPSCGGRAKRWRPGCNIDSPPCSETHILKRP